MGKGWNLGNSLDACNKGSEEKVGIESENYWGNPSTTEKMISYVKQCGFRYAASSSEENMKGLIPPDDNRVLVSVPYYYEASHDASEPDCAEKLNLADKANMYETFRNVYKYFLKNGYSIVIGEYGWTDRVNIENLAAKTEFYNQLAEKFGVPTIIWDDGGNFRVLDRNNLKPYYNEYLDAMI